MIAVSYHDRVNVLQGMGMASVSPFDRPEWFELLAEEGGVPPMLAVAQDEAAMAALPLTEQGDQLLPLLNWYNFTWRPLATIGTDAHAPVTAIARDLLGKARRVTLYPVPAEDGSAALVASAFRDAGWAVIEEICDTNHILRIEGRDYATYLESRPGPLKTTLKRKAGKLETEVLTEFDPKAWHDYEAVYSASWKPEEGKPAMLRRFAELEGVAGRLRLGIARADGRAVAAQFWTLEQRTAYIHKLAHSEEGAALSAGTVLTAAMFEHVIDRDGATLVDFGTGNDPYKSMWMEESRPRYRLDCHRRTDPRAWPRIVASTLRNLASRRSAG